MNSDRSISNRKEKVQAVFSKAATSYDAHAVIQHQVANALTSWLPEATSDRILELGCGTGNYTERLLQKYPSSQIDAVDFSQQMINVAAEKITNGKIQQTARVHWLLADAEEYCAEALRSSNQQPYSLITSNSTFQWFEDLPLTLSNAQQLLADDGNLVFAMFGPKTFFELQTVLSVAHPDATLASTEFIQLSQLQEILEEQFSEVQLEEQILQQEFPSLLDLLRQTKYTGTSSRSWKGLMTPDTIRRLETLYLERFETIQASYQIWFCRAVK